MAPDQRTAPFTGVVVDPGPGRRVAVKDMIAVAGMPQTAGLPARAGRIAEGDAEVVTRLRAAGWAIAGVTATDAAGFGTMTPAVANPRHPGRAVGGSSGGAAAAVASGLVDLGLGTDTGGSGRIPAAYCDLSSFKPSYGRTPMAGVLPLSESFDTLAILARDVATLAAAAPAFVPDWRAVPDGPPRCVAAAVDAVVDAPIVEAFARALALLPKMPVRADPFPYDAMAMAHGTIVCAEALSVHRTDWMLDRRGFPEDAAAGLAAAQTMSARDVDAARRTVAAARAAWRSALAADEVLVIPTLPMAPASRFDRTAVVRGTVIPITNANIRLTLFASVAGLPVVTAQVAELSLQFVGAYGRDEWLLASVEQLLGELGGAAGGDRDVGDVDDGEFGAGLAAEGAVHDLDGKV